MTLFPFSTDRSDVQILDMAFRVFQIADQGAYFVILIFCAFSCVAALTLRFVATHRSNRKPAAEDWFALVAVLLFLARVGFMLDCRRSHVPNVPFVQTMTERLLGRSTYVF